MAKILCFDDEAKIKFKSVIEYLEEFCKHEIDVEDDLYEAEIKIKNNVYDVLLLDIRINQGKRKNVEGYEDKEWTRTGVRLIEKIRNGKLKGKNLSTVPIIAMTAVVHPPTLKEIIKFGEINNSFISIIQKPPRLADIESEIKGAINFKKNNLSL